MTQASIIIPVYNQSRYVELAFDRLNAQNTDYAFEVILADDGSKPQEISALKDLQYTHPLKNRAAIKFVTQEDRGFRLALSRNNGLSRAEGDHIIFMDGDVIPVTDKFVEKRVHALLKQPDAVLYCDREYVNSDELERAHSRHPENIALTLMERKIREKNPDFLKSWGYGLCYRNIPGGGGLRNDPNFEGWGWEDSEFVYRLVRMLGKKPVFIDDPVRHVDEPGVLQANPFENGKVKSALQYMNNALYFMDKYPDDKQLEADILRECDRLIPPVDIFSAGKSDQMRKNGYGTIKSVKDLNDIRRAYAEVREAEEDLSKGRIACPVLEKAAPSADSSETRLFGAFGRPIRPISHGILIRDGKTPVKGR